MNIFPGLIEHKILFVSHLCFFLENLEVLSDDQREWFHHNRARMEQQYQVRWDLSMMGDWGIAAGCSVEKMKHPTKEKSNHNVIEISNFFYWLLFIWYLTECKIWKKKVWNNYFIIIIKIINLCVFCNVLTIFLA